MSPHWLDMELKALGLTAVPKDRIRRVYTQNMISFRELDRMGQEELKRLTAAVQARMSADLGRALYDGTAIKENVGISTPSCAQVRTMYVDVILPN